MNDKLQAWCMEVITEFQQMRYRKSRTGKSAAQILTAILRKRTDFRLVDPLPEGAVPVRIYAERNSSGIVETHAVDAASNDDVARQMVTSAWGTHRSATDAFLLPVVIPVINAEPRGGGVMLDLDAIERVAKDDECSALNWKQTACDLLAELRKCRAALRSVQEGIGIDGTLSQSAYDNLDEALRGAK
mgnify:FL=1